MYTLVSDSYKTVTVHGITRQHTLEEISKNPFENMDLIYKGLELHEVENESGDTKSYPKGARFFNLTQPGRFAKHNQDDFDVLAIIVCHSTGISLETNIKNGRATERLLNVYRLIVERVNEDQVQHYDTPKPFEQRFIDLEPLY